MSSHRCRVRRAKVCAGVAVGALLAVVVPGSLLLPVVLFVLVATTAAAAD